MKTLYVVGIGPGDPELITMKAAGIIRNADKVFCLRAEPAGSSLAGNIVRMALGDLPDLQELVYPLSRDSAELEKAWAGILRKMADSLPPSGTGAVPTLGDPSLYSTGVYIQSAAGCIADLKVVFVPGVTSPSAAAAAARLILASGESPCSIVPAPGDPSELYAYLNFPGVLVVMKIGRRYKPLAAFLRENGWSRYCHLVVRAGTEEENVFPGLPEMERADMAILFINCRERLDKE